MEIQRAVLSENPFAQIGFVSAAECIIEESAPELIGLIENSIASAKSEHNLTLYEKNRKLIRDMLRWGGFKPTGRNKPASEYIINNAVAGNFPYIFNAVDINNLISILYHLPVSTIDTAKTSYKFILKEGKRDEEYIFNKSGQIIDIEGLLTVYDRELELPVANPIKDSQRTKLSTDTKEICIFLYSSKLLYNEIELSGILSFYKKLLIEFLKARIIECTIL